METSVLPMFKSSWKLRQLFNQLVWIPGFVAYSHALRAGVSDFADLLNVGVSAFLQNVTDFSQIELKESRKASG